MTNELIINTTDGSLELFSARDTGANELIINSSTISTSDWVGTGTYTTTIGGVTYTITKAAANTGNLMMIQTGTTTFTFYDTEAAKDATFRNVYATNRMYAGTTSDNGVRAFNAKNSIFDVSLNAGYDATPANASAGLYDHNQAKWIIRTNNGGAVYVNGTRMYGTSNATATNDTNYVTSGTLNLYRRGNVVQISGSITVRALSARTTVATIPDGYKPVGTMYAICTNLTDYVLINSSGEIQCNAISAKTIYFAATYAI